MQADPHVPASGTARARRAHAATTLGMLALGTAAAAKAWWADDFHASLEAWSTVPEWGRVPLTLLLPTLEWGLVAGYFLFPFSVQTRLARMAFVLVAVFTAMLLIESSLDRPPPCNCFGKLLAIEASVDGLRWALLRNALLLALLAPAWLRNERPDLAFPDPEKPHAPALS